ncbi:MAG TPA: hypothetical protein VGQ76_07175 [Thermoanaerobaculia bacterium]|jgi:hypothetical protein|nr:hypothetical protein [Thermoanaerobaculia bacterium]
MLILAAVLTTHLDLSPLIQRNQVTLTCGIATVGYRFRGKPGQTFRYAGDGYEIPNEGWIELIADRQRRFSVEGKSLPLDVWPRDPFGFRDVPLP